MNLGVLRVSVVLRANKLDGQQIEPPATTGCQPSLVQKLHSRTISQIWNSRKGGDKPIPYNDYRYFLYFTEQPYGLVSAVVTALPASTSSRATAT